MKCETHSDRKTDVSPFSQGVVTKSKCRGAYVVVTFWEGSSGSCNRVSQNLKVEDLDLNSYDYEKEGKNQGKN